MLIHLMNENKPLRFLTLLIRTGHPGSVYIAFVPSFLAQVFFIRGVELVGASKAGLFINFLPIFAAILGVLLLGEKLYIYHLISLFIVLFGVYLFMILGDKEKKISS